MTSVPGATRMENKTYYNRKALHLCVRCGKQTERTLAGRIRCKECEDALKFSEKYRDELRRKNHQCLWCGRPAEGRLCDSCREIERWYAKKHRMRSGNGK